nr:MAG TPA: hypothetical protein [Caudoviricetes sp.]
MNKYIYYISYLYLLNNRFLASVTATIERYVADMNYVMEKVQDTPLDVLVSLKLCECQSRNYANVLHR